jgi:hypothetical protein
MTTLMRDTDRQSSIVKKLCEPGGLSRIVDIWLRMFTSGSMAAPSRDAAVHPCCFHDLALLRSHGLWPHLSPGTDHGLSEGSMTSVSGDCLQNWPICSPHGAAARRLRRLRPCCSGLCCAGPDCRVMAGLMLLKRDPPQMSHFSYSDGYWRGCWRRPPSRSG